MIKNIFSIFVLSLLLVGSAFGTALTAAKNTPSRAGNRVSLTITNGLTIYAGAMVGVDAAGEAVNAADTAGIQVVGRASKTVDNTDDGEVIDVDRGIFGWLNAGDVAAASIGDICFVIDNQTVSAATNGSNSIIAGTIVDVDSSYVWVDTKFMDRAAVAASSLTVSGATTLTGKLTSNGETECNEDVDINLNATDEEIIITQTAVAGPGSAGLIIIDDDRIGATALTSDEATITITAAGVYGLSIEDGALNVESDAVIGGDAVITGESSIDGKYGIVGGDAATGLMIIHSNVTASAAVLNTNTFATVFGTTPIVTASYTEDPGDVRSLFVLSVNPTNVVFTITADKNYSFIAVGARP